jgi:hypothetical protein
VRSGAIEGSFAPPIILDIDASQEEFEMLCALAIGFRPDQRAHAHDCVSRILDEPTLQKCNRALTGIEAHPLAPLGSEARKRERAMLVACRLAGLSALGAHYAGVK